MLFADACCRLLRLFFRCHAFDIYADVTLLLHVCCRLRAPRRFLLRLPLMLDAAAAAAYAIYMMFRRCHYYAA